MEKEILIKQEVLQRVVDYLSTRPFIEVFQLIAVLQQSVAVEPQVEPEKEPEPEDA